jgi:hypothetical protein
MSNSHKGSQHHEGSHSLPDPNGTGEIHTMEGISTSMAIFGIIMIILVSHFFLDFKKKKNLNNNYWKFNILKIKWLKSLINKSYFPLLLQSIPMVMLLFIIGSGFWGSQRVNIGPVLTWTWWWVLLIFFILGFGKVFCSICPWEGISSLLSSLTLNSRIKKIGYEKPWPKWARNVYPALILFILLTWFELGNDITRSPKMTALMALVMLLMAIASTIVFEKRAFCRYACLVGRVSGLYALFSPVELRAVDSDTCLKCTEQECYKGNETSVGCPTNLFTASLKENTYCTLCTECVRSCPHDNIAINLRPMATDLLKKYKFRWDESILAIVLLAMTSFHGITMTPSWNKFIDYLKVEYQFTFQTSFTFLMIIMTLAPILLFWLTAFLSKIIIKDEVLTTGKIFKAFSYAIIPVALFYHLAHNGMHFFMEAQNIIPLLSDPLGFGWDLFGTARKSYGSLLSLPTIWWIQLFLLIVGHVYGVIIADKISKQLFMNQKNYLKGLIPLIVTMIFYSAFSVWLIAQPMEMRTGM